MKLYTKFLEIIGIRNVSVMFIGLDKWSMSKEAVKRNDVIFLGGQRVRSAFDDLSDDMLDRYTLAKIQRCAKTLVKIHHSDTDKTVSAERTELEDKSIHTTEIYFADMSIVFPNFTYNSKYLCDRSDFLDVFVKKWSGSEFTVERMVFQSG